jgi:ketosteroid isomerase-like protein
MNSHTFPSSMKRCICLFAALVSLLSIRGLTLASEARTPGQESKEEETLWNLERAYWRYVQDNDLPAYSNLWHKDFLGWPSVNAAPVRKDHIRDWITAQTGQGLVFKTGDFKPAAIHVTGDVAMVCYWITFKWLDKAGHGSAYTLRITHAWLRTGSDWRIIGGMSMPEPEKKAE